MPEPIDLGALEAVITAVTKLAVRYRDITGKPLGITGEVGEFRAARLLGWQLAEARQKGYDAIASDRHTIQIKARCVPAGAKRGQRVGQISFKHEWNTVALILMDGDFVPLAVYEADRERIRTELERPGSRARNERGALSVEKFKSVATRIWSSSE